jgi:hypothetical protein
MNKKKLIKKRKQKKKWKRKKTTEARLLPFSLTSRINLSKLFSRYRPHNLYSQSLSNATKSLSQNRSIASQQSLNKYMRMIKGKKERKSYKVSRRGW